MRIFEWLKYRSPFGMAFMLQRITGVVLALYLCLHLVYLTSLRDESSYESLTALTVSKQFFVLDSLLILFGVFHGINGVRIIIHELGFAHERRRAILAITAFLTVFGWILGSYILYTALGE